MACDVRETIDMRRRERKSVLMALVFVTGGCVFEGLASDNSSETCSGSASFSCSVCGADVAWPAICRNGKWGCPDNRYPIDQLDCPPPTCPSYDPYELGCCNAAGQRTYKECRASPGRSTGKIVCPTGY